MQVAGSTFQQMDSPSSRTYIGSGKVLEIADAVRVSRPPTCGQTSPPCAAPCVLDDSAHLAHGCWHATTCIGSGAQGYLNQIGCVCHGGCAPPLWSG